MTHDLTDEVKAVGSLNFEGNIIPIEWYSHLRLPNNKPDLISIHLLSEIIYWYRPTTIRDERSGKIIGYKKKFRSDLLQKSYHDLEEAFGLTKDQIKKSLQRLEQFNLIKRVFRHINSQGTTLANVMFIQIFPEQISRITEKKLDMGINTQPCENIYPGVCANIPPHPSKYTQTYTEITTETTTKKSLSSRVKSNSIKTNPSLSDKTEEQERENEMLKIWNELVEEKNDITIKLTPKRKELLSLRLKEVFNNDISLWKDLCKKISSSKFLMGEVTSFKAQLDWVLKEDNLLKIMENSYTMGDRSPIRSDESIETIDEVINDPIWRSARERLKKQLGEGVFKSWIAKLKFQATFDGIAHFTAPTKFIKEWIITNYSEDIKRHFNATGAGIQQITIQSA